MFGVEIGRATLQVKGSPILDETPLEHLES
jgi:hypothetical protein